MGILSTVRKWFAGSADAAGFPAIGDVLEGAGRRYSLGSYHETLGHSGHWYDGGKWAYGLSGSGRGPILDHSTLRVNARTAVHDSMVARGIVERYEQTVVDTGVRVECTPAAEILGITPEQAEEWARDVELRFHLWANSKLALASEDMTFYQAQRFSMRARMRDGETFIRCQYKSRRDLLNPLRISFLDPNQIMGDALTDTNSSMVQWVRNLSQANTTWPGGTVDGIKRDDDGRELSYSVIIRKADNTITKIEVPAKTRSGLPMMLHGYAPEYAGQQRGFSKIAHAIHEFQLMTDFTEAQIKKAIVQSSLTMTAENEQQDTINPMADMVSGPAGPYQAPEEPDSAPDAAEERVHYSRINDVNLRPGSVGVFLQPAGQKLKPFESSAPAESFASFVESFVGYLAQSVNVPPEILAMKFSENYSASRAALIMFWRVAGIERDEEASDFYTPVYKAWLMGEIAAGRIQAAGWADPRLRAAWCLCNWNGPPMPNIDPAKTAKADKDYIEMGAQTPDSVARTFNGSSGAANRAKNARQIAELTEVPWSTKSSERTPEDDGGSRRRRERPMEE